MGRPVVTAGQTENDLTFRLVFLASVCRTAGRMTCKPLAETRIQDEKFQRINLSPRRAMASLVIWLPLLGSTALP